jgi:prephenate dehydrogenase
MMGPSKHDRIAAVISHIPQLLAVSLVNWAADHKKENDAVLQLAAGGFRDMTRIASSPFAMWKDIIDTNQIEIERQLDGFIEALRQAKLDLQTGKLGDRFSAANSIRHTIPKDSKGFLHPLHEILVVVDDRPGVIAGISQVLAKEKININDIEVVKVREGEGGTIRMAFDTRQVAEKAVELLEKTGYTARMRE